MDVFLHRHLFLEKFFNAAKSKADLFTSSFNKQAFHKKDVNKVKLAYTRISNVRKFALKCKNLTRNVSRYELSMRFAVGLSRLIGKNAFSLFEQSVQRKLRVPGWVKERGTIMGPGAIAGSNLIKGRFKQYRKPTDSVVDLKTDFEKSTKFVKRFKRLISKEIKRLIELEVVGDSDSLRHELIRVGKEMLSYTDTAIQFDLCETGNIFSFNYNLDRKYRRRPDLVYGI